MDKYIKLLASASKTQGHELIEECLSCYGVIGIRELTRQQLKDFCKIKGLLQNWSKNMDKLPVKFAENIIPFCHVCGSGEYMNNEDGNKNDYCGQCGTALDWENMENIDTE